jgi:hypothetical protein
MPRGPKGEKRPALDAAKAAYHVHQVLEAMANASQSKWQNFVYELKEIALMVAAMAVLLGVFWLLK